MIFNLIPTTNDWIQKVYEDSMKELNKFFGINWIRNTPHIILVQDRKSIDTLNFEKTQRWFVGWKDPRRRIFLLTPKNFEKESNHKFSKQEYAELLKHELAHSFTENITKNGYRPYWLSEGISIYLSRQFNRKTPPEKFKSFLNHFGTCDKTVYQESGFAVKFVIEKYGKEKFLNLLKSLENVKSKEGFLKSFHSIYKFNLNYENFNKEWQKNLTQK